MVHVEELKTTLTMPAQPCSTYIQTSPHACICTLLQLILLGHAAAIFIWNISQVVNPLQLQHCISNALGSLESLLSVSLQSLQQAGRSPSPFHAKISLHFDGTLVSNDAQVAF